MQSNTLDSAVEICAQLIHNTIDNNHVFKAILSKPSNSSFQKVKISPYVEGDNINIKVVSSSKTQDFTSSILIENLKGYLEDQLSNNFKFLDVYGDGMIVQIRQSKKGKVSIIQKKSTEVPSAIPSHNRDKVYVIPPDANFLKELGISNSSGKINAAYTKKYRQINKFIEIIDKLIEGKEVLTIADMGSGKGYLTFALYWYLTSKFPDKKIEITGYEIRQDLIDKSNDSAQNLSYDGLSFVKGHIGQIEMDNIDLLIALHACDIATDMAIHQGIKSNAKFMVLSPCCHKQIRKAITKKDLITNHGIYEERTAEMVTDTIRALLLESKGYSTSIFEFISNEHTAKNTMITAQKAKVDDSAIKKIESIKARYGISKHYLEDLFGER